MPEMRPGDVVAISSHGLARFLSTNKPLIVVWLALFVSIAGVGMVSPLLPKFAQDMGASGIWLGLVFSGFAFSQIPLMPMIGKLSDRFGEKLFLWLGLVIYAMAAAGYFWSPSYKELFLFRVFSGIGAAMVIPTAFAYAGKLASPGQEGRYMGIFNIALIAGFGIGPVIGGLVYDSYGMDATFTSMGILSAVGFLVVLLFLPSTSPTPHMVESDILSTPLGSSGSMTSIVRDDNMLGLVTFQLVWGLSYGAVLAFLPIFMTTIMGTSVAQVGIVLSTRSILSGTLAYPFGWLADRMNRVFLVSTGMIVMAVGVFFIPWVEAFALMLCLFITMAICESSAFPAANAITVDRGRSLGMGSTMGVFFMAMSAGLVIGSIGGGVIEGSVGVEWVFRYAAVAGLVGVVTFNVFMRRGIARRSL